VDNSLRAWIVALDASVGMTDPGHLRTGVRFPVVSLSRNSISLQPLQTAQGGPGSFETPFRKGTSAAFHNVP
jgi:hypothetical protein